jgi:hypothetical protein
MKPCFAVEHEFDNVQEILRVLCALLSVLCVNSLLFQERKDSTQRAQSTQRRGLPLPQFTATETAADVVVHHAGGLHERVADGRAYESKSAFL